MTARRIVVIGAGIVGAAAAIWLKRADFDVTLIDKGEPGTGASFGNAGVLAACSVAPVTGPGLVWKAPKLLLDPNFPLFMRWSYLPKLAPWLARYLSHANDADTRRIAEGLAPIVSDSVEQHRALVEGTAAEGFVRESAYSFAYKDRAAFEADAYVWALRREAGFEPDLVEGAAVRAMEPVLSPEIGLLAVMRDHGFVLDPGAYVGALVRAFEDLGGVVAREEVVDFEMEGDRVARVRTKERAHPCDEVVLAAGVFSKPLMAKLGLDVPLEAERGYHILFRGPNMAPRHPIMIASGKFVATPMRDGLRCAGVVEFGGVEAGPSNAPLSLLRRQVEKSFPGFAAESEEEWLGFRPAPSDSLPVLGEIGQTRVYAAFGHHHIGLTGGPKTGRLIADLIGGRRPNIDMSVYGPERFGVA